MVLKILTDLTNYREIIEEQKKDWLYELLYFLGIDIKKMEEMPSDKAVEYLLQNNISIEDYPSMGALRVEHRETPDSPYALVGEWAGPEYSVKRDSEDDKMYYEISIECWSIADEGMYME